MSSVELGKQLRAGYVGPEALRRFSEAETYGNVSAVAALTTWFRALQTALRLGHRIEIEGDRFISTEPELMAWLETRFPQGYAAMRPFSGN
jgi:hypothetical protein